MKIYAPVKNATGVWCNVHFVNGVGETDKPHLIEWFKKHGYKVESEGTPKVEEPKIDVIESVLEQLDQMESDEPDFESMTPLEIREWAVEHGLGSKIKNIRSKDKLIEIVRG